MCLILPKSSWLVKAFSSSHCPHTASGVWTAPGLTAASDLPTHTSAPASPTQRYREAGKVSHRCALMRLSLTTWHSAEVPMKAETGSDLLPPARQGQCSAASSPRLLAGLRRGSMPTWGPSRVPCGTGDRTNNTWMVWQVHGTRQGSAKPLLRLLPSPCAPWCPALLAPKLCCPADTGHLCHSPAVCLGQGLTHLANGGPQLQVYGPPLLRLVP